MAKMTKSQLKNGAAILMITPLTKDYKINEDSVRKQIDWLIEKGAIGLWPRGFIGEWPGLDEDTSEQYFKVCADHAKGKGVHVAAGCHAYKTAESIRLANYAEKVGCDFAWVCAPGTHLATEAGIYQHYQKIIDNTSIPLAVYNSTPSGTYMKPRILANILNMSDRFIAMKDSVMDFCHQVELYRLGIPQKVAYYCVCPTMMIALHQGNEHIMCNPEHLVEVLACYNAFKKGDIDKAWKLQQLIDGELGMMGGGRGLNDPGGSGREAQGSGHGRQHTLTGLRIGVDMGPPTLPDIPSTKEQTEAIKKHVATWRGIYKEAGFNY